MILLLPIRIDFVLTQQQQHNINNNNHSLYPSLLILYYLY